MWYADLSPWGDVGNESQASRFRAVGWLERGKPFVTGPVDTAVYEQLVEMLKDPWRPYISMGFHRCDVCLYNGDQSGKRDLFVPGDGVIYVAPELITHYMNAHWYQPPDEFCLAVLACPPMRSMPYLKALMANGAKSLIEAGRGLEGL
jgi:hypothetical protein